MAWLEAGSPQGNDGIPTGVLYAVHPDLRPAKATAASNPARQIAHALRASLKEALTTGKDTDAARVVGLAKSFRDTLNGAAS